MTDTSTTVTDKLRMVATLLSAQNASQAIQLLRECLETEPNQPAALIQLGELLRHTPDIVAGIKLLRRGLAIQPTNVIGWLSLGSAMQTLSQLDGAQAAFRNVLDLDPNRIEALNDLGTLLMERSEWASAISLFQRATDLAPDIVGIRMNLARAIAQDGRSKEALQIAESVEAENPGADTSVNQLVEELTRTVSESEMSHSLAGRHYNLKAERSVEKTLIDPQLDS